MRRSLERRGPCGSRPCSAFSPAAPSASPQPPRGHGDRPARRRHRPGCPGSDTPPAAADAPGEPVELAYDVYCIPAGVEDPERGCEPPARSSSVRPERRRSLRLPLRPRTRTGNGSSTTVVPPALAAGSGGFEYYAVSSRSAATAGSLTIPAGGAEAPHRTCRCGTPIDVEPRAPTGSARTIQGARVASAPGATARRRRPRAREEHRRRSGRRRSTSTARERLLLDEAHRRLLRWGAGQRHRRAFRSRSTDGSRTCRRRRRSIYVLETVARPGRQPLVRRFDESAASSTSSRPPSAHRRRSGSGPPARSCCSSRRASGCRSRTTVRRWHRSDNACRRARAPAARRRRGRRAATRQRDPRRAVVAERPRRSAWRITSQTPVGEVQLAEPLGQRLVLVVRAVLGRAGRVRRPGPRSERAREGLRARRGGLGGDCAARSLPTRRRLSLPARLGHTACVRRSLRPGGSLMPASRGFVAAFVVALALGARGTAGAYHTRFVADNCNTPPRRRPRTSRATARRPSLFEPVRGLPVGVVAAGTTTTATTPRTIPRGSVHRRRGRRLLRLHVQGLARGARTKATRASTSGGCSATFTARTPAIASRPVSARRTSTVVQVGA